MQAGHKCRIFDRGINMLKAVAQGIVLKFSNFAEHGLHGRNHMPFEAGVGDAVASTQDAGHSAGGARAGAMTRYIGGGEAQPQGDFLGHLNAVHGFAVSHPA